MAKKTLVDVIASIFKWQAKTTNPGGRCLECVRFGCTENGMKLPLSNVDYKGNFAVDCGEALAKNPAKWGWKLVGTKAEALPTNTPALVYFRKCGFLLKYMRYAGHVAIWRPQTKDHVSNRNYGMSQYWKARITYIFIPLGG